MRLVDERQHAKRQRDRHTPYGAALLVDIPQEAGRHAAQRERLHGAGGTVDAAVGDGDDGDRDNGVEDGGQARDAGVFDGEHEGRGLGVGAGGAAEVVAGVGHDEAHDEEGDDVC